MKLWDKFVDLMVIPDDDIEDEAVESKERPSRQSYDDGAANKKADSAPRLIKSKTINYSQSQGGSMQVVLVKPDRYDEVTAIADHLNSGKTVVLNLEETQRDVSRRIVDFLSGAAYANSGNVRKVAKNTFIIVARGVDVMGELMLEDFEEGKIYF